MTSSRHLHARGREVFCAPAPARSGSSAPVARSRCVGDNDTVRVRRNLVEHRYEAVVDDEVAGFTEYVERSGRYWFVHTEVDAAFDGAGVGSSLVRGALDDMRSNNALIVPICPFVAAWISRHPEYQDLVDSESLRDYERRRRAGAT